jgi:hypothetical protein
MTLPELLTLTIKTGGGDAVLFDKPVSVSLTAYSKPVNVVGLCPLGRSELMAIDDDGNYLTLDRAGGDALGRLGEGVKNLKQQQWKIDHYRNSTTNS